MDDNTEDEDAINDDAIDEDASETDDTASADELTAGLASNDVPPPPPQALSAKTPAFIATPSTTRFHISQPLINYCAAAESR